MTSLFLLEFLFTRWFLVCFHLIGIKRCFRLPGLRGSVSSSNFAVIDMFPWIPSLAFQFTINTMLCSFTNIRYWFSIERFLILYSSCWHICIKTTRWRRFLIYRRTPHIIFNFLCCLSGFHFTASEVLSKIMIKLLLWRRKRILGRLSLWTTFALFVTSTSLSTWARNTNPINKMNSVFCPAWRGTSTFSWQSTFWANIATRATIKPFSQVVLSFVIPAFFLVHFINFIQTIRTFMNFVCVLA